MCFEMHWGFFLNVSLFYINLLSCSHIMIVLKKCGLTKPILSVITLTLPDEMCLFVCINMNSLYIVINKSASIRQIE